jgi:hypothetical protein
MEEAQKKEVVISEDDIKNVRNFYQQFNSPIPQHLEDQLNEFTNSKDNYTVEQQQKLKVSIARSILEAREEGSPLIKDILQNEVWDGVVQNCRDCHFDAQFDEDVVEEFSKEETEG